MIKEVVVLVVVVVGGGRIYTVEVMVKPISVGASSS